MKLERLDPGDRFAIPSLDLTGTLVRLTPGSATVQYDGSVEVVIQLADSDPKTFQRHKRSTTISRGTEVRRLAA